MIKVGVTGGIGSGKSIICEIFSKLGINVYNADTRAKILTNENLQVRDKLIAKFGPALFENDQLNKKMLAEIIFNNKTALEFVNSVIHPAVNLDFEKWCKQHENEPYIIKEAALLFESGLYKKMDIMVTVYAPEDLRLKHVILRDKITPEQVMNRMKNQLPDEEKINRSDFVIYNDGENSVLEQVLKLHEVFLSELQSSKSL